MEAYEIKKEFIDEDEEGESIYKQREYIIKNENVSYILKIEIKENNIYFILSLNDSIEYNYKTKMSLSKIVNKLELNPAEYSNWELILKLLDEVFENEKLLIKIINIDYCNLMIKLNKSLKESTYEIILNKTPLMMNDKFAFLLNQINLLKIDNNKFLNEKIEQLNNKLYKLSEKILQNDKEIKDIKDIIDEMNEEMESQENQAKDLENKNNNLNDKYGKNINDKIAKLENNKNDDNFEFI